METTDEGGFLCLRLRDRGAMVCLVIPGDYTQNRHGMEFCKLDMDDMFLYTWACISHSSFSDPDYQEDPGIDLVFTDNYYKQL